jgi:hypothetical protein
MKLPKTPFFSFSNCQNAEFKGLYTKASTKHTRKPRIPISAASTPVGIGFPRIGDFEMGKRRGMFGHEGCSFGTVFCLLKLLFAARIIMVRRLT